MHTDKRGGSTLGRILVSALSVVAFLRNAHTNEGHGQQEDPAPDPSALRQRDPRHGCCHRVGVAVVSELSSCRYCHCVMAGLGPATHVFAWSSTASRGWPGQ